MKKTVLVYDDDKDLLEICGYLLKQFGYYVVAKQVCSDVITDVLEIQPDIVLIDLWMPETGGKIASGLLKQDPRTTNITVFLFSAADNIERTCIESGADGYIKKPFDIHELRQRIDQVFVNKM